MRSTVLLASALAMGAIAKPVDKRYMVTKIDVEVKTVTVIVTATGPPPAALPTVQFPSSGLPIPSSSKRPRPRPRPSRPARPSGYPIYTPVPSVEPTPEEPSIPDYTYTAPGYTDTPTYTPTPIHTPDESTEVPEPTSTPESTPTPEPSSETPTPTPSPSTPVGGGGHKSGEIQATFSSGPDYEAAVLYHHNAARANHGAKPLVWDADCEANALIAAKTCRFEHYIPEGAGQGQNLFTVSGDSFNVTAGITESWYKGEFEPMGPYWGANEIPDEVFHSVGHLTQMLWKDTTKVGCVSYDCGDNMIVGDEPSDMNKYTVCNYAGPGNVGGEYAANVGEPVSTTNLGSWSD